MKTFPGLPTSFRLLNVGRVSSTADQKLLSQRLFTTLHYGGLLVLSCQFVMEGGINRTKQINFMIQKLKRSPELIFSFLVITLFLHTGTRSDSTDAPNSADLDQLSKQIDRGKYKPSIKRIQKRIKNDKKSVSLSILHQLIRALRATGQYESALEQVRTTLNNREEKDEDRSSADLATIRVDRAQLLMLTGDYKRAREVIKSVIEQHPSHMRARWIRVRLNRLTGKYDQIKTDAEFAIKKRQDGLAEDTRDILYGARIRWLYATWNGKTQIVKQVINDLARANKQDPKNPQLLTFWANCYLEKRHDGDAKMTYKDVLNFNSSHPGALTGMARIFLRKRTSRSLGDKKAQKFLKKALQTNPGFLPALLSRAKQQLVERNYEEAWKTIQDGMKANDRSPHILALKATYHYVQKEKSKFKDARNRALQVNPKFGTLYSLLAEVVSKQHQYPLADKFYKKATSLNPHLWTVTRDRGMNATRLGNEKEGKKLIQKAFENNPFDVLSYNFLELLDKLESSFNTYDLPGYKVRIHKSESEYAKPYIFRLLRRARRDMRKRYGMTLDEPTLVEIFEDHRDFSVRTVGMQGLGALGACFGTVTTALSPRAKDQIGGYNWGAILWHEMAHAYALQMSNMNVPRWFTEGLSVYEESRPYSSWKREMGPKLFKAWKLDKLPSIKKMDRGEGGGLISYYLYGSVIIEYIVKTHSFDHVLRMLKQYGQDHSTETVFRNVLDTSISEFQKGVDEHMKKKFGDFPLRPPLKKKNVIQKLTEVDLEDLAKDFSLKNEFDPESASYDELIEAARFARSNRKLDQAKSYLKKAIKKDSSRPMAHALLGDVPYREKNWSEAISRYRKSEKRGVSDLQTLLRYGRCLDELDRVDRAIEIYEKARKTYPAYVEGSRNPYLRLFKLYKRKQEPQKMIERLRGYVDRAHKDFKRHMTLARLYRKLEQWSKAREILERLIYINYRDLKLHTYLAEAYKHEKNWKRNHTEHRVVIALLKNTEQKEASTDDLLVKHYLAAARASKKLNKIERARQEAQSALDINQTAPGAIKFLRNLE